MQSGVQMSQNIKRVFWAEWRLFRPVAHSVRTGGESDTWEIIGMLPMMCSVILVVTNVNSDYVMTADRGYHKEVIKP